MSPSQPRKWPECVAELTQEFVAELPGQENGGNVTLQFGGKLCGQENGRNVTLQFGGKLCGQENGRNVTLQFGAELSGTEASLLPFRGMEFSVEFQAA